MNSAPGFLKNLLLLTVLLAIAGAVLFTTFLKEHYLNIFPFLLVFFALITLAFHMIIERSFRKNPQKFSYVFMGLSAGKLMAMLGMIVIYLIVKRETVIPFLVGTFLLYLVFTLFEVKTLLRLVQGKK